MTMFKRSCTLALVICSGVLGAAACSGLASPVSPSSTDLPSAMQTAPTTGATIQGIVSGASAGSSRFAGLTSTTTVRIVGTNISAPVSTSGTFLLVNVPAGSIQLRFETTSGVATSVLGGVDNGDRLDLKIRIVGSVGVVDASVHIKADRGTVVEGEVTSVSGTCPNLTLMVNGWTLKVETSSQGSCGDIKIGVKVKIKGTITSANIVVVVRIESSGGGKTRGDSDSDKDSDRRRLWLRFAEMIRYE